MKFFLTIVATALFGLAGLPPKASAQILLAGNLRVEGGVGYANGGTDMNISTPGVGSVSTDMLGSGGVAAEAGLWWDNALNLPAVSLGAQYLYFGNSGSVSASSAGPFLGVTATANLDLITNALMFNAAWRPDVNGFHPFLGGGVGVAFSTLSGSALGYSTGNSQDAVAGQVFLGFDYDLTSNVYAGVTGRFFVSEATYHATNVGVPNSIDITNRPISLLAHLGVRF
jgi:hypothetical protein